MGSANDLVSELPHGYCMLQIESELASLAQPGHAVCVENNLYYLSNQVENSIELIIPQSHARTVRDAILGKQVTLTGEALIAPSPDRDYIWQASNQGINACVFYMRHYRQQFKGIAFLGADDLFPFKPCPSKHLIPHLPQDVIAALPLFDDWNIAHRLASLAESPGCFHGTVETLTAIWQQAHSQQQLKLISFLAPALAIHSLIA